jgi:hypothetical protein
MIKVEEAKRVVNLKRSSLHYMREKNKLNQGYDLSYFNIFEKKKFI